MFCDCGDIVELERELLGLTRCLDCAQAKPQDKLLGRMSYLHKTAGFVEILPESSFNATQKYYNANGARSCVKNFSKSICK